MKQKSNNCKLKGITVVEVFITIVLISVVTYIGTRLIMDYRDQFEWGHAVSIGSFSAINALDSIENELVQASSSSIVLSNQHLGSGGYQTIDFPKVTGFNVTTKNPIIDSANTIRFTLEDGTLNKYIVNKTIIPETIVSGPHFVADNVISFLVNPVSHNVYNISITVQKNYQDGRILSSTYSREIYLRNK